MTGEHEQYRSPLSCMVDNHLKAEIIEYKDDNGYRWGEAVERLINLGIEKVRESKDPNSPKGKLAAERRLSKERDSTRHMLIDEYLANRHSPEAFEAMCQGNKFDAADIIRQAELDRDNRHQKQKTMRRDKLGDFISGVLALAGEEGLTLKIIYDLASELGFSDSTKQVERTLHDLDCENVWKGNHNSRWRLKTKKTLRHIPI